MADGIRRRLVASASAILIATSVVVPASAATSAEPTVTRPATTHVGDAPSTPGQSQHTETATESHVDVAIAERAAKAHPRAPHRPSPMRPLPHATGAKARPSPAPRAAGSGRITRLKTSASATAPTALAGAAVSGPPYTAFFLDGGTDAGFFSNEVDTYTPAVATFLPQTDASGTGNLVYLEATGPNGTYAVEFVGPDGADLAPGTYTNAVFPPLAGAGQPGMFVGAHNIGCSDGLGTFTITQFAHTLTTVTALAASFSWACPGHAGTILGAVRYGASSGLSAMSVDPSPDAIGNVPIGLTTPATITIENSGTTTLHLGAFSLTGSSAFALGSNPCASATLAAGASCTITVTVHPTGTGATSAMLSWTDDSTRGSHAVPLSATAVVQLDVAIAGGQAGSAVDVYPPSWTTPAETCASASCSFDVTAYADQTLRLVARPPVGGAFTAWSQDCSGRTPCLLSMTTSRAATATFAPILTAGATNLRVVDGQAGTRDTEFGCPIAPC